MMYDVQKDSDGKYIAVLEKRGKVISEGNPRDTMAQAMDDGEAILKAAQKHKPGTPPNTHLVLTPAEITYCGKNGGKSAVIHKLLACAMKRKA